MTKLVTTHKSAYWLDRLKNSLVSLLLPVNCLGCGEEGEWICADCRRSIRLSRPKTCILCSKSAQNGLCQACRKWLRVDGAYSLSAVRNPLVWEVIKSTKSTGCFDSSLFLIKKYLKKGKLPKGYLLVPIPLSADRFKERGYNQSEVIAERLSQLTNLNTRSCLTKIRDTEPQNSLKRKKRLTNPTNCFEVKGSVPEKIILVDDVITTGSTIREAAKVLRKAGVKSIWAFSLAHG